MEPELAVKTLHRTSNRVHRSCEATVLLSSETADLLILYEEKDVLAAAAGRTG